MAATKSTTDYLVTVQYNKGIPAHFSYSTEEEAVKYARTSLKLVATRTVTVVKRVTKTTEISF